MSLSVKISGRISHKLGSGLWSPFRNNVAVNTAGSALAAGLAALDGKSNSIYHGLGLGRGQWDVDVPNPDKSDVQLVDEFYRKTPTSVNYMVEYSGFHETTAPNPQDELDDPIFATLGSSLLVGRTVEIISGTNAGDVREILSLSGQAVTLDSNLSAVPDATTKFRVAVVSTTPTNVIDVETVFLAAEDNSDGQIREQGLFLGEATQEIDSGTLMSYIRHPVLTKSGSDLTQIWRIKVEVI